MTEQQGYIAKEVNRLMGNTNNILGPIPDHRDRREAVRSMALFTLKMALRYADKNESANEWEINDMIEYINQHYS